MSKVKSQKYYDVTMYHLQCITMYHFSMATGMVQFVLTRGGGAYRCVPCGYVEKKSRTELHFYNHHIVDSDTPFVCVTCDFKTGDKNKLDTHLVPGAFRKVGIRTLEGLDVINLPTPRHIQVGKDIVKLSKEYSARHWTKVSISGDGKEGDISEDLRPQLLGQENMELTPKRVVLEVDKSLIHRSTQTHPMSLDRVEEKVDSLKGGMVQCIVSMFWYMEQLKELNASQEGVIKNVEERLDKMQKDEQEKREVKTWTGERSTVTGGERGVGVERGDRLKKEINVEGIN